MGLVYEVVWHRQFSLIFGSGAPASAATLASFFTGLSLGNFLFGRIASKWSNAIRLYGVLEILVGLGALGVTPVLQYYAGAYPEIVERFGSAPAALLGIKGLLGLIAVAVPTVAMGATLPVLANMAGPLHDSASFRIIWLYFCNTLGAALGALLYPILLLPLLGTDNTVWLCASLNVALGLTCLFFPAPNQIRKALQKHQEAEAVPQGFRGLLFTSFISGFGIFSLQVLWNRAFAQVHENSLLAFAYIATLFILAIAAGTAAGRALLKKGYALRACGRIWVAGGALVLLSPYVFLLLTERLKYGGFSGLHSNSSFRLSIVSIATILIPVALLSSALPFLLTEGGRLRRGQDSRVTGSVLGWNTLGSIVGALITGFALPGLLGLWKSIFFAGLLFLAVGLSVMIRGNFEGLFSGRATPWQRPALMASRAFVLLLVWLFSLFELPRTFLDARAGEQLVALAEGPYGIAAVTERKDGSRRLKLNNHYVLGGTLATGDQRMQAHIPLLLGRGGRVGFLGYGTGITAGAALFHPEYHPLAVELVPEVVQLASRHFAEASLHFAQNTNTAIVLDDARIFLRAHRMKFDVLVGDLVVPWRGGESALYTLEHFKAVYDSLADDGIFCSWVPLFQVSAPEFQIILRTFLEVFGSAYLWRGDFSPTQPAYALIAFKSGGRMDRTLVLSRLKSQLADPSNPQLQAEAAYWMNFVGLVSDQDVPRGTRLNRENSPWLELIRASPFWASATKKPFAGRDLQEWENSIRAQSRSIVQSLGPAALSGWQAGQLMVEFTQLLSEGRRRDAEALQPQIRKTLGDDVYRLVFEAPGGGE
ncbi:MAG TPA: hypothetical protein VK633_15450 [Verrucomicrobiae bacterium]|nr:hypothetical protein [Verrucomicrobiae bacterium]